MTKNFRKQIGFVLLIALHLGSTLLLQSSHQHVLYGTGNGQRTIQGRECRANEIHKPLDEIDHCLLCLRVSSFVAVLGHSSTVPIALVQPLEQNTVQPPSLNGVHLSDSERGPPLLTS